MAATGIDAALIERWALAYLGRYASSAEGLRRVLLRRVRRRLGADRDALAVTAGLVDALVERYRQAGLVDDAAYAVAQARARLRRGQSLRMVGAALAARGIDTAQAAAVIDELRETTGDPDLAAACAFARRRRLGPYRRDAAERDKELAAFGRAGFSRATAKAVLGCASPEEVEELMRGDR